MSPQNVSVLFALLILLLGLSLPVIPDNPPQYHSPLLCPDCSVIWISIDMMGSKSFNSEEGRDAMPFTHQLAKESIFIPELVAQEATTIRSHMAFMTGKIPAEKPIQIVNISLYYRLQKKGYYTAAFLDHNHIPTFDPENSTTPIRSEYAFTSATNASYSPKKNTIPEEVNTLIDTTKSFIFIGLEDGFLSRPKRWKENPTLWRQKNRTSMFADYRYGEVFRKVVNNTLYERKNDSWKKVKIIDATDRSIIEEIYFEKLREADTHVQSILSGFNLSNTVIIISSEHGMSLLQHGGLQHHSVYEEEILVPFILRLPKKVKKTIHGNIPSTEMKNLLLSILNMTEESPATLLSKLEKRDEPVISTFDIPTSITFITPELRRYYEPEHLRNVLKKAENNTVKLPGLVSIRQPPWKLIWNRNTWLGNESWERHLDPTVVQKEFELYNLKDDPEERTNLAELFPEKVEELKRYAEINIITTSTPQREFIPYP